MKTTQKVLGIVLVALLGAVAYGLSRTGHQANAPETPGKTKFGAAAQAPIVDQSPLQTAQRLAKMPISDDELPFAQEALRLTAPEKDPAFARAVRETPTRAPALS